MSFQRSIALCLGLFAAPQGAVGQVIDTCEPQIVLELSDAILAQREDLTGFARPRFGAIAAYTAIHYRDMPDDEALAFLERLSQGARREAVDRADEMAFALAVAMDGPEAALAAFEVDLYSWRSAWPTSTEIAAVFLADDGATYFAGQQAYLETSDESAMSVRFNQFGTLWMLTLAQPQERRARIVENAFVAGDITTALNLSLALDDDFATYEAIFSVIPEDQIRTAIQLGSPYTIGLRYSPRFHDVGVNTSPEAIALRDDMALLLDAARQTGLSPWVLIYVNQTGQTDIGVEASRLYLDLLERGHLDPVRDPEGVWLAQYDMVTSVAPALQVNLSLSSFDFPSRSLRHFARTGAETLALARALSAGALITDEGETREMPFNLNDPELWETVIRVSDAMAVGGADTVPDDPIAKMIALELMWRRGQTAEAVNQAAVWLETQDRLPVYRDWLGRMDLACDAITHMPNASMYTGGQVVYRFPAVPFYE